VALVALIALASVPRPASAASSPQSFPVSIDKTVFSSTIPSYALLGRNYTVKVLVSNTSNEPVPIILRVNGPVNLIYTHPLLLQLVVGPGQQVLANFSLVPFSIFRGPINMTAVLWVWFFDQMSRPEIAEQVSAIIGGVQPSQSSTLALVSVVALVSAATVAAVYVVVRRNRRGNKDILGN